MGWVIILVVFVLIVANSDNDPDFDNFSDDDWDSL